MPSSYRAVNTFHLGYKNQSVYAVSGTSRCLFSDKYTTHKYSMGRTYNCWMLNCWCITWPVGFKRLIQLGWPRFWHQSIPVFFNIFTRTGIFPVRYFFRFFSFFFFLKICRECFTARSLKLLVAFLIYSSRKWPTVSLYAFDGKCGVKQRLT